MTTQAACCCRTEEEPGDDPVSESGCCPDFNDELVFTINYSTRVASAETIVSNCACVTETNTDDSQWQVSGRLTWNIPDGTLTWNGTAEGEARTTCSFGCVGQDCRGQDCFSSCPCTAVESAFASGFYVPSVNVGIFRYDPQNVGEGGIGVGACCSIPGNPTGRDCEWVSPQQCQALGGVFLGEGTTCRDCGGGPTDGVGKCCLPQNVCVDNVTEAECLAQGGNWSPGNCPTFGGGSCAADGIGSFNCDFGIPGECYIIISVIPAIASAYGQVNYTTSCANAPQPGQDDLERILLFPPVCPLQAIWRVSNDGDFCRLAERVVHSADLSSANAHFPIYTQPPMNRIAPDYDPCDAAGSYSRFGSLPGNNPNNCCVDPFVRSDVFNIQFDIDAEWE